MLRDRLSSSDRGCAQAYGSMEYEIAVAAREAKRESDLECSKQVEKLKHIACHNCGKKGHYATDCPDKRDKKENQTSLLTTSAKDGDGEMMFETHNVVDDPSSRHRSPRSLEVDGKRGAVSEVTPGVKKNKNSTL